jgi:hypothetical protein
MATARRKQYAAARKLIIMPTVCPIFQDGIGGPSRFVTRATRTGESPTI